MSIYNFSPGPAILPPAVMERLSVALAPAANGRPSVAEISHRGNEFKALAAELHERLRRLTGIGEEHAVFLLQGGASQQFFQLPMNLAGPGRPAAYLISGYWGAAALAEAQRVAPVHLAGSSESSGFSSLPESGPLPEGTAFLHYTGNESIHGVQFFDPPAAEVPRIADLTSEFLSRPYPYSELDVVYASAQKNFGIGGLTVVLMKKALLEHIPGGLPEFLDYRSWVDKQSIYNTPATFSWHAAVEMLRWIEEQGGLTAMEARSRARAELLYAAIDESGFWVNPVQPACRSLMNVPFWPAESRLTEVFLAAADAAGLTGLKGHRSLGGMRASLYNAQTLEAVQALVDFMRHFEKQHG